MKGCGWLLAIGALCGLILLAPALAAVPDSASSVNVAQKPRPTRPANLLSPDYIFDPNLPDRWPEGKTLTPGESITGAGMCLMGVVVLGVLGAGFIGKSCGMPKSVTSAGQWAMLVLFGLMACFVLSYLAGLE